MSPVAEWTNEFMLSSAPDLFVGADRCASYFFRRHSRPDAEIAVVALPVVGADDSWNP